MFSTCALAATRTCPGLTCPRSMKASVSPSSCTTVAGICPATILQKTQFGSLFTFRLLVACALHLIELAVLQAHGSQRAAPDAPAVQQRNMLGELQPERRPVPAENGLFVLRPEVEPGSVAGWRLLSLGLEIHLAIRSAEAHPRHDVDDDSQPIPAGERLTPRIRRAAVHIGEELPVVFPARAFSTSR